MTMFSLPLFTRPQPSEEPFSRQTVQKTSRLRGATVTESVCPYCAVGCGQLIYTKAGKVIDIEGDPRSPISEGPLCPKGADAFQLAVSQASPMIQEMFPGRVSSAAAAGFVGLLSLFNMAGRFCWSSLSDSLGRKTTYALFFLLGAVLYALTPLTGNLGSVALFVLGYAAIISMYGGGFATMPTYLRDLFGTAQVGRSMAGC
jgi:Molybdopterin oxidoreductase Fe4S4 domain